MEQGIRCLTPPVLKAEMQMGSGGSASATHQTHDRPCFHALSLFRQRFFQMRVTRRHAVVLLYFDHDA